MKEVEKILDLQKSSKIEFGNENLIIEELEKKNLCSIKGK
jgi:hypothetical protein